MSKKTNTFPTFESLINPTLAALHNLGGSGSINEIVDDIIKKFNLPSSITELPHGKGSQTELEYRAAWARNYLKNYGLIENSERGVWALSAEGRKTNETDSRALVKEVQRRHRENALARESESEESQVSTEHVSQLTWKDKLLEILLNLEPTAFERLCQRLLRESGFLEVEVTKRSGDGGIDGYGTIRIGGLISFNVLFQSKRYKGSIGPEIVRDFRGAMVGRADKGLIITTGNYTREARKEATRDGAPPIDLIDGDLLVEKLKELKLGIIVKMVESVEIIPSWFSTV